MLVSHSVWHTTFSIAILLYSSGRVITKMKNNTKRPRCYTREFNILYQIHKRCLMESYFQRAFKSSFKKDGQLGEREIPVLNGHCPFFTGILYAQIK